MTLLSILLVAKTGIVNAVNVKEVVEADLYKRAGFKHVDGFEKRAVYPNGDKEIHVFGKVSGRAGQENKYEFPPPIAETLFFGTVVLVSKVNDTNTSLTVAEWEQLYDVLMGGFEDLADSETTISSSGEDSSVQLTHEGYVKDNFVVDDDDEEEVPTKRVKKPKKSKTSEQAFVSAARAMTLDAAGGLECSRELTEEEYDS